MPFAANDKISQEEFPSSIEITNEQYAEALEGMCSGLVVTIDGGFKITTPTPPEPEPIPAPTPEELTANALAMRDQLLRVAAIRIAPLQDAVELDEATDADTANLKKWKQYRVAVNRIQDQPGFPQTLDWPIQPS